MLVLVQCTMGSAASNEPEQIEHLLKINICMLLFTKHNVTLPNLTQPP